MYQGPALRRRAYLGLKVGRGSGAGGLAVLGVAVGGPAATAGVRAGDLLAAIDDRELGEIGDFVECVRAITSDRVVLRVEREGARLDLVSRPVPLAAETFADGEVRLEEVRVAGHLLRAIYTVPRSPGPHPGVLSLQGLGAGSCEFPLDPEAPGRRLIEGWTRSGLVTLRLERSGVGDSEGPAYRDTDFDLELAAARAAFAHLSSRSFVDPKALFLFGHSVGGMIAPLLAAGDGSPRPRGIAVFGTSALPWDECLVGALTRQQRLAGLSGGELDAVVGRWAELYGLVCRQGLTPGEAFARRPHLAACRSADVRGALLFDRCVAFSRQLQAVDLARAWRSITAPALVLHGENDWICSREEAQGIVELTAAAPAGRARLIELPGLGHDLRAHDDSLLEATRAWIAERAAAQPSAVSHGNTQP